MMTEWLGTDIKELAGFVPLTALLGGERAAGGGRTLCPASRLPVEPLDASQFK